MSPEVATDLTREALRTCLLLAAPLLGVAFIVGLVVGVLQTATQVHEGSIGFATKLVAVAVVVLALLPWLVGRLVDFTAPLISGIPGRL